MSRLAWLLLGLAALVFAVFGVAHALGGRDQTAFILGDPTTDPVLGAFYLVGWLGAVVVGPILVLAAGWLTLLERLRSRRLRER